MGYTSSTQPCGRSFGRATAQSNAATVCSTSTIEATGARRSKLDLSVPSPVLSSSKLPLMSTPTLPLLLPLLLLLPELLLLPLFPGPGDNGSPEWEFADKALLLAEMLRNAFFQREPASEPPEAFFVNVGGGGSGGGGGLRLLVFEEGFVLSPPSSTEPTRLVRLLS